LGAACIGGKTGTFAVGLGLERLPEYPMEPEPKAYAPFPRSTTPSDPDPRKTAPLEAGMFAAAAFTGVAGIGIRGSTAAPIDWGGMYSWPSITGLSRELD
jgi:hypothetical protein